jgi:hypothetical protein
MLSFEIEFHASEYRTARVAAQEQARIARGGREKRRSERLGGVQEAILAAEVSLLSTVAKIG